MSAFVYIINKSNNTLKFGLGIDSPDNFMNRISHDKLLYLKFFPKHQLRYIENNFQMFISNDEIIKNFDNVYIFFNEICYNSFIKEQIRLDNNEINEFEYNYRDSKFKKKFVVRKSPKIILIKPKLCYNNFTKKDNNDKPDKSNKRKYILCH